MYLILFLQLFLDEEVHQVLKFQFQIVDLLYLDA